MDNIKNRIMVDSPTTPKYKGVFDAYRKVWGETYDGKRGLGWNSQARMRNFYRVSAAFHPLDRTDNPYRASSQLLFALSRPTLLLWQYGRESCAGRRPSEVYAADWGT
jgi:hypothetical protein